MAAKHGRMAGPRLRRRFAALGSFGVLKENRAVATSEASEAGNRNGAVQSSVGLLSHFVVVF